MMMRGALILSGVVAGLAACAPVSDRAPQTPAPSGAFGVAYQGITYQAMVGPGAPGRMFTRSGAQPVAGQVVSVGPFGMAEGKRAKDVAALACTQANGRFQPQAVGRFARGAWIFEGGCA